jgi:hypothetical protein
VQKLDDTNKMLGMGLESKGNMGRNGQAKKDELREVNASLEFCQMGHGKH